MDKQIIEKSNSAIELLKILTFLVVIVWVLNLIVITVGIPVAWIVTKLTDKYPENISIEVLDQVYSFVSSQYLYHPFRTYIVILIILAILKVLKDRGLFDGFIKLLFKEKEATSLKYSKNLKSFRFYNDKLQKEINSTEPYSKKIYLTIRPTIVMVLGFVGSVGFFLILFYIVSKLTGEV